METAASINPALHLCIATGQNLANLIPALQCDAREVWVLQTPSMLRSAAHLAQALKARGIEVEAIDFADDAVTALHAQAESIALRLDGRPVVINLTGGTKLMTLALVQTLAGHLGTGRESDAPHLVYTDTAHHRLDWLGPAPRSEPMRSVLTIDDILRAQGYRRQAGTSGFEAAEWQRRSHERDALTRHMGKEAKSLGRFFGTLNGLARAALNEPGGPWQPLQSFDFSPGGKAAELLDIARRSALIDRGRDDEIVFRDPDAALYLGGGWIEEFAGMKISGSQPDGGWAPRLRIEHVDSRATNEIDAVVVHGNRMLAVECKSARAGDAVADWISRPASWPAASADSSQSRCCCRRER